MKKLLLLAALVVLALAVHVAPASAHGLQCDQAKYIAGHPNAYCNKTSENHVWLYFPWKTCQEHVYWSHRWDGTHEVVVVHCWSTWSHNT